MAKLPSLSLILCGLVIGYTVYCVWSIAQLFLPPSCTNEKKCFKSSLKDTSLLNVVVFSSPKPDPRSENEVLFVGTDEFSWSESWDRKMMLDVPKRVRENGSFYLHLFLVQYKDVTPKRWIQLYNKEDISHLRIPLTQLHIPDSYIFNLLDSNEESTSKKKNEAHLEKKPVSHLRSKVTFNVLTDPLFLPSDSIPPELYYKIRISHQRVYYPVVIYNFLETKIEDLKLIKNESEEITLRYSPINIGKLRFVLHLESALLSLKKMGFSNKDIDDVKGIFVSTNFYLLSITIVIVSFHLLFDFLAFKNDVKFWRHKSNMEGLSSRTVMWRAFSQLVIFFYLMDEKATVIVLVPSAIATMIEFWKVVKVLRRRRVTESSEFERKTDEYDAESMRYLSYVLYPLCIGGAIYSLLYQPHKSWYSWCIHSMVNGVYAFGFLFMLPQLFVNYRLKSVASLPWRAFMYKAFNTFIDDVFAFIITMPAAHRVACFRDDIIFLIYLYQRWLYPVDQSRLDETAKAVGENQELLREKKLK